MKKMRRTWAILLALVLTVALAVPGFAAEGVYSITITNDKAGHTYEAYQIFAGTVASDDEQNVGDGDGITGPMLGNIIWGTGVNGDALLVALKAADNEKYVACATAADVAEALGAEGATAADAAAFAEIAAQHLTGTHYDSTKGDGVYTISNLPAGYYLVKDQDGSLQGEEDTATEYIVQVLGNVTMEPKDSDIPTVEKKVSEEDYHRDDGYGTTYNDVADWDIGDSVPFKLIGSIPDMSAYNTYEYIFTDTLSNGLTLQEGTINVYIALGRDDEVREYTPLTEGEDYTLTLNNVENGGGSFSITFDDLKTAPYIDQGNRNYVIVTYDATLNANAEIGLPGNPNSVDLQFSNDPNGDGLGRTTEDTVIVFTYELDGTKVDGEDNATLPGAQFVLFNGGYTRVAQIDANGRLADWLEPVDINPDVTGNNDAERMANLTAEDFANYNNGSLLITSNENGKFSVAGLDDGTYYLREIKAPDGYNLLDADLRVVIDADTANGQNWDGVTPGTALTGLTVTTQLGEDGGVNGPVAGDTTDGAVAITVENNGGSTLPETGGIGTTIFYAAGALLVLCAGVLLFVKLRMRKAGDE
ncbi:MAG TPA: SpaH/EbpB family LPXTG-anchored major pilin [Candidatus Scatomorpha gallistercoris]|nr:SpaH/EbpB family LPXTG-anchored major pilin [Candidatus Scatomorpha gallistercoris]